MNTSPSTHHTVNVAIGLNAVLAAVVDDRPKVLCVQSTQGMPGLPHGPFDPKQHRTLEIGMRAWVERQTNVSLGFIEQLYTFGDQGREAPAAALDGGSQNDRIISVGYLALTPAPDEALAQDAAWRDWYYFFPWEDWREGEPNILRQQIIPGLRKWVESAKTSHDQNQRRSRMMTAFGMEKFTWEEERILDRYELLYEAGLVTEAFRDRQSQQPSDKKNVLRTGAAMISDHRRILATAIGRLRGKLKYRPVIFDMMGSEFTLLQLQQTAEAIVGFEFHKQNFRRSIEKSGFVENTGKSTRQAGGRPAALFSIRRTALKDRAAAGLAIPRLRRTPE